MRNKNVWIIGAGNMAREYAKVLRDMDVSFEVVGKGAASADEFQKAMGISPFTGGLERWLEYSHKLPDAAIVTVDMEALQPCALALLDTGVKRILLEIPGGVDGQEVRHIAEMANACHATVLVAYNRRFYSSVRELIKRVDKDGGATSLFFEFTEWKHVIEKLKKPDIVKNHWVYANSVHVMDTAFFICGEPEIISTYHVEGSLAWHKPAIFCGAGITKKKVPFCYHANWDAPGRWGIEVCTLSHRYYLRPMEKLHVQNMGSLTVEEARLDDDLDTRFKPGLYLEVKNILGENIHPDSLTAQHHGEMYKFYEQISGYGKFGSPSSCGTDDGD